MKMEVKERLIKVIGKLARKGDICISDNTNLNEDIGIDSVDFIKLIVEIETEFDFIFDDEYMNYELLNSFGQLCVYVESKISI